MFVLSEKTHQYHRRQKCLEVAVMRIWGPFLTRGLCDMVLRLRWFSVYFRKSLEIHFFKLLNYVSWNMPRRSVGSMACSHRSVTVLRQIGLFIGERHNTAITSPNSARNRPQIYTTEHLTWKYNGSEDFIRHFEKRSEKVER